MRRRRRRVVRNRWQMRLKTSTSSVNCFFFNPSAAQLVFHTNLSPGKASWRYRVTGDLSQKEVISLFCFFYFWILLTFPHISQIAFWHKSQGNICGDLFYCCREGKKNNEEETVRLFNVQIHGAVACLQPRHQNNSVSVKLTRGNRGTVTQLLVLLINTYFKSPQEVENEQK